MPFEKIYEPIQVDCLVCVEFANEIEDPFIFQYVLKYMVHCLCTPWRCVDEVNKYINNF